MSESGCACCATPKVDADDVAYWFYRPVVEQRICSMNKVHNHQTGVQYLKRLRDGREVVITKDEYDRRPK